MTRSYLTDRVEITSDSSSREGVAVDRFILHHAATPSLAAILSLFAPGGRTVSANYALGGGVLVNTVDEDRRAWTTASGVDDRRSVTIEVANAFAGEPWPVRDEDFDLLARLIADVATRHGFPIDDDHVLTHQEVYQRFGRSYATACPGDLQRRKSELLELARHYQTNATPASQEDEDMPLSEDDVKKITESVADRIINYGIRTNGDPHSKKTLPLWRLISYTNADTAKLVDEIVEPHEDVVKGKSKGNLMTRMRYLDARVRAIFDHLGLKL